MDIAALKVLLAGVHPVTGAWDPDAEVAAAQFNAVNCTQIKTSMTGDEVFAATNALEFDTITDHRQIIWLALCGRASIDPASTSNITLVNWIFGSDSATLTALATARTMTVSFAAKEELGLVRPGNIMEARA